MGDKSHRRKCTVSQVSYTKIFFADILRNRKETQHNKMEDKKYYLQLLFDKIGFSNYPPIEIWKFKTRIRFI